MSELEREEIQNDDDFYGYQNDDDFYGDQEVTRDTEVARQKREVEALRRHHFVAGLREGASEARDASLQGGFDRGFFAGAKTTAEPGFILGTCAVLDAFYSKNESKVLTEPASDRKEERETLLQNLEKIRDSSKRLRAWLCASAVQPKMDVHELRQVCENIVSLEIPNYPVPETIQED